MARAGQPLRFRLYEPSGEATTVESLFYACFLSVESKCRLQTAHFSRVRRQNHGFSMRFQKRRILRDQVQCVRIKDQRQVRQNEFIEKRNAFRTVHHARTDRKRGFVFKFRFEFRQRDRIECRSSVDRQPAQDQGFADDAVDFRGFRQQQGDESAAGSQSRFGREERSMCVVA